MTKSRLTALTITVLGLISAGLRLALFTLTPDAKGLLPRLHPLELTLWAITALAFAAVLLQSRDLPGEASSRTEALGTLVLGLAMGFTAQALTGSDLLGRLCAACGMAALAAMTVTALTLFRGQPPFFPAHLAPVLYLVFFLLSRYRVWSAQPQLQEHVFSLLGGVFLMLLGYHRLCLVPGTVNHRRFRLAAGLAAFCCLAALGHCDAPLLYLGGALWALTQLLLPLPPEKEASHEAS